MNTRGFDFFSGSLESLSVNSPAISIVARWRIRLVQCEPFLGLLDAVVMELVVHPPRAQRLQQIAPDLFRKLAGVNPDAGNR